MYIYIIVWHINFLLTSNLSLLTFPINPWPKVSSKYLRYTKLTRLFTHSYLHGWKTTIHTWTKKKIPPEETCSYEIQNHQCTKFENHFRVLHFTLQWASRQDCHFVVDHTHIYMYIYTYNFYIWKLEKNSESFLGIKILRICCAKPRLSLCWHF